MQRQEPAGGSCSTMKGHLTPVVILPHVTPTQQLIFCCTIFTNVTAGYTEYAGLEISVYSCIASLFSRQIAIGNGGPVLGTGH